MGQITLFPEARIGTITGNGASWVQTITISCVVFQRQARGMHVSSYARSFSGEIF